VPIWWRTTRGSKPGTTRGSGPEDENHGEPKRRTNTRVRETRSLYSDQHEGLIPRDLTRIPETPRKLLPSRGIKTESHKAYKLEKCQRSVQKFTEEGERQTLMKSAKTRRGVYTKGIRDCMARSFHTGIEIETVLRQSVCAGTQLPTTEPPHTHNPNTTPPGSVGQRYFRQKEILSDRSVLLDGDYCQ
jgi:hypothetical protein